MLIAVFGNVKELSFNTSRTVKKMGTGWKALQHLVIQISLHMKCQEPHLIEQNELNDCGSYLSL